MPLPLGHVAIGLATYETIQDSANRRSRLGVILFILILANLPDVDVILGLIFQGNGNLFHRGPTHSLLFAFMAGWVASQLWRWCNWIPRLGFPICFGVVLSHVLADMLLTAAPVSLLWPFQVYWSPGFSGWESVIHTVLFNSVRDVGIVAACTIYFLLLRLVRHSFSRQRVPAVVRRQRKPFR